MRNKIEIIGYPEGNVIYVTQKQFEKLEDLDFIRFDDEPNYDLTPEEFEATDGGTQWRFNNEDEGKIRKILKISENLKAEGNMELTEKKKLPPMLARIKKKKKLKKEDIMKYGTKEEVEFLKETQHHGLMGYEGYPHDEDESPKEIIKTKYGFKSSEIEAAYKEGYDVGYKKGYADAVDDSDL